MTMSTFSNNWYLVYTPDSNPVYSLSNDEVGAFLGNGKIGMLTSFDDLDVQRTFITGDFTYDRGQYKTNTLETFHANACKVFTNDAADLSVELTRQELAMDVGIAESSFQITQTSTSNVAAVTFETYAVRQFPFCIMTTLTITASNASSNITEFNVYNEPYALSGMQDVAFNNNVIYNDQIQSNRGMYILSGEAKIGTTQMVFANAYLFEVASPSQVENLGFNVYRFDPKRCYNKFRFKNLVPGQTIKMHILSTLMTNFDFENPIEEVKRIALTLTTKEPTDALAASKIREIHVRDWDTLWSTNVSILPKTNPPPSSNDLQILQGIQRHIKYALYNIYASIRENVNLEINPLNLAVIDIHGKVLLDGDLWLLPLLTLLKPLVAKTLVEYRHTTLQTAIQMAAGYGFKGAKYPYVNDVVGYKNALYWDTISSIHVFNTAVVSINVWNYYRISIDDEWLRNKGYAILKNNADFFVSLTETDEDGVVHIKNTVAFEDERVSDDNAFTNTLIRLGLRYALEASYELGYRPRMEWREVYEQLNVPFYPTPDHEILKFDTAATSSDTYKIAEPLFLMFPIYSYLLFNHDIQCVVREDVIKENLTFYQSRFASAYYEAHPYNVGAVGVLNGLIAQKEPTPYVNDFYNKFIEFTENSTVGLWQNFKPFALNTKHNDITMNALYLLMLLFSVCGISIQGGVAETKFYYEEMKVKYPIGAVMPPSWLRVIITGMGSKKQTANIVNSYTA